MGELHSHVDRRSYRDMARPYDEQSGLDRGEIGKARLIALVQRSVERLSQAANLVATVILFLIMMLVTADVLLRTCIDMSIPGASEIAGLMQALMVFFGLAYTLRTGQHIKVDMLMEHLPGAVQRVIDLIMSVLALAVFLFVTYAMYHVASGPRAARETSDLLAIHLQPFKFAAAMGAGLMCLEILVQLVRLVTGNRKVSQE